MVATYELECTGCGAAFTAKSPRAKWHTPGCKKAAQRKAESGSQVDQAGDGSDHEPTAESVYGRNILEAVRRDLEAVGQLDTVDGRIALYLARKSIDPDAKNSPALFKQMSEALEKAIAKGTPEQAPTPEPEDEVQKARHAREQKAREAAAR